MSGKDVKMGPPGSLINSYMTDRRSLIDRMQKDGWDVSQSLESQREWVRKQKREKTKKTGVLLVHQLAGLIEQVDKVRETDKAKNREIADLKKKVEILEGINQEQSRMCPGRWTGCNTDPLPPYGLSGPTAPTEETVGDTTEEYFAAPVRMRGQPGAAGARADFQPFTPGERQQILKDLGNLQTRSANTKFWANLDMVWLGHSLHLRDIHQLVRAACPVDRWRLMQTTPNQANTDYKTGRWTEQCPLADTIDRQQAPFNLFKTEIQRVLGEAPTNWSKITSCKQQKGEGASEYGERLFIVYGESSGQPGPARTDPAFIQAFKDGLSPAHQAIIKMGVVTARNYDDLVEWACGVDGLKAKEEGTVKVKQESVSAVKQAAGPKGACHGCGKPGHFIRDCKAKKTCTYCNKKGHTEATCFSKHGRPETTHVTMTPEEKRQYQQWKETQ